MEFFNSLLTRFVIAGALMLALVLGLSLTYQGSLALQGHLAEWRGTSEQMSMDLMKINALADKYKQNAPRDYESYNRDLIIFNEQFQQAIANLGGQIEAMDSHAASAASSPLWLVLESSQADFLTMEKQPQLSGQWLAFNARLHELIGDPEEPRLEWAAEYVISVGPELQMEAAKLTAELKALEQQVSGELTTVNSVLLCAVVGYILLGFVAFLMWVIRPVIQTARACEAVATGNYGHTVKIQGSGETRHLQQSFNELSWSAGLMLDLVRELSRSGDVPQKLEGILASAQKPLDISWIGFMRIEGTDASLISSAPGHINKGWKHRNVSLHKSFGRLLKATSSDDWLDIDDLSRLALNHHDERFLRELHKHTRTNDVMGYGFDCPLHQRYVLLFASTGAPFKPHQKELLKNLSALMANSILEAMADLQATPVANKSTPQTLEHSSNDDDDSWLIDADASQPA